MIRAFLFVSLAVVGTGAATAAPIAFDDIVDSRDNLFYTDWGHWYTQDDDGALNAPGSQAARAAQFQGSSYNFAGYSTLQIQASGIVQGHAAIESGPDGCANPTCDFHDDYFRMLPAYSLIGIWSSSATEIIPFGDWKDLTSGLGLMFIGSSAQLLIPQATSAYLFLAENDGAFSDNFGHFKVSFLARTAVPEPGVLSLLCAGLFGIAVLRNRRDTGFSA